MPTKDLEIARRGAPLDMSAGEFRTAGHGLVDQIADWLEQLPDGAVMHDESPGAVRRALDAGRTLPEQGEDAGELLGQAFVPKHEPGL